VHRAPRLGETRLRALTAQSGHSHATEFRTAVSPERTLPVARSIGEVMKVSWAGQSGWSGEIVVGIAVIGPQRLK